MKFHIPTLLEVLDNPVSGKTKHLTSVIGVIGEDLCAGIYKHYRDNKVEILQENVTEGKKKGKWLDRWIVDDANKFLYQTEIKNWAGAAIGGYRLEHKASHEELEKVATRRYGNIHNDLINDVMYIAKVRRAMRKPVVYQDYTVTPLLLFWMPVSDNPETLNPECVITCPPKKELFNEVTIFSCSLYLRSLSKKRKRYITIDAPNIKARLKMLESIIVA